MKHRGGIAQVGLAAAAVGIVMVPAGAHAGPQLPSAKGTAYTCQQKLEGEVEKLHKQIYGAMQKCKDAIRKEISIGVLTGLGTDCKKTGSTPQQTGGCMARAAHACEGYLKRVYEAAGPSPFTTAYVQKFKDNIEKLRNGKCQLRTSAGGSGTPCGANSDCTTSGEYCDAVCPEEVLGFSLSDDGSTLGHLVSGAGGYAPPAGNTCSNAKAGTTPADPTCRSTFLQDFLLFATEKYAIKQQLMTVPGTLALFQDAATAVAAALQGVNGNINTVRVPIGGSQCNAGICSSDSLQTCTVAADCTKISSTTYRGTSCASSAGTDANLYEQRPNLCRFGVECRDHVCALAQKAFCLEGVCNANNAGTCCQANPSDCCDDVNNCPTCITAVPYSSFLGLNLTGGFDAQIPILGALSLEMCRPGRVVGVCKGNSQPCQADSDCSSGMGPCNLAPGEGAGYTFMAQNNFLYLINQPSKTLHVNTAALPPPLNTLLPGACLAITRSEGFCDCAGTGLPTNFTMCQDHVTGAVPPSGGPGPPSLSTPDACSVPVTNSNPDPTFSGTLEGTPVISTSGSTTAGDCVDLVALQSSLLTSTSDFGPDGIPCTEDDFAAPAPPFSMPLTTGTASAQLHNAVASPGVCVGGPTPGAPCVQDVNCGTGGICNGEAIQALLTSSVTGGKSGCLQYLSGDLSGMGFAGAIATSMGPTGDTALGFRFGCK
jgi:hypothetical protein